MEVKEWIKRRISEYYSTFRFPTTNLSKREFGIGDFGKKIERRHFCFNGEDELKGFLIKEAPLYLSYSSSFYNFPCRTPMEAKERVGTELIFDIDSEDSSKESLMKAKDETLKLIDILREDFGVKHYTLNFSGNRGFHLHIHEKRFFNLSQEARKKLVEYLLGELDHSKFFSSTEHKIIGPKLGDRGYKGRFAKKLYEIVEEGRKFKAHKDKWRKALMDGNYSVLPFSFSELIRKTEFLKDLIMVRVDVDGAVTYDLSKLIRVPNSIHGSTGFVAKIIREGEIEEFNPYEQALPFGEDEKVLVKFLKSVRLIGENEVKVKGTKERIEKSLAFILSLRGFCIPIE